MGGALRINNFPGSRGFEMPLLLYTLAVEMSPEQSVGKGDQMPGNNGIRFKRLLLKYCFSENDDEAVVAAATADWIKEPHN